MAKRGRWHGRIPSRPVAIAAPVLGFLLLWPATVPTTTALSAGTGTFVDQAGLSGVEPPPTITPTSTPPVVSPPPSSSAGLAAQVLADLTPGQLLQLKLLLGIPGAGTSPADILPGFLVKVRSLSPAQEPGSARTLGLQTLSFGSVGAEVALVQAMLAVNSFSPGPVDGIFGPLTEAAVRAFQRAHGLQVDGIVGRQTLAALFSTLA